MSEDDFFDKPSDLDERLAAFEVPFTHVADINVNVQSRSLRCGLRDMERFEVLRAGEPDLVIIAARPGNGKTAFLVQLLRTIAATEGDTIMFSLEMSKEQLKKRIISAASATGMKQIKHLDESRLSRINDQLRTAPFLVDDTKGLDINTLRARAMSYAKRKKLAAVGVDYLQIVRTSVGRSKREEVLEVTEGLKQLANDLSCPVVALAQMSRMVEQRQQLSKSAKPVLSDLAECSGLENWADEILMLDAAWRRDPSRAGELDCYVEKHRHGETGKFVVRFQGETMTFRDMEETL